MPGPIIPAVVLAAGRSSRMGDQNKLLLPLGGQPIIRRTVMNAMASQARPVIVITGHQQEAVAAVLSDLPVTVIFNSLFETGMSSSLAAGLRALPPEASHGMILLGDMPLISSAMINAVLDLAVAKPQAAAIVPVHQGAWAHPVILHRTLFSDVMALDGDHGARAILKGRRDVQHITADDPGSIMDADTPDAYRAMQRAFDLRHSI
ncbi:MAG: nucleotidyltransferase family protein [Beijerinckiaceae bacterium]